VLFLLDAIMYSTTHARADGAMSRASPSGEAHAHWLVLVSAHQHQHRQRFSHARPARTPRTEEKPVEEI
jgi:hypothetical protein